MQAMAGAGKIALIPQGGPDNIFLTSIVVGVVILYTVLILWAERRFASQAPPRPPPNPRRVLPQPASPSVKTVVVEEQKPPTAAIEERITKIDEILKMLDAQLKKPQQAKTPEPRMEETVDVDAVLEAEAREFLTLAEELKKELSRLLSKQVEVSR
ncbi:MAG: hypothetical protein QXD32_04050 [Nitrososphaerota archaeon]